MASRVYQIAFQLGGQLLSSYGNAFNRASEDLRKLENGSKSASRGFLGLGEGATTAFKVAAGAIAGLGIAEVAKKSVELASNLVEVQNVVDTTFGGSSTQIDSWSKSALNAFGLSELQAKQFNGTMGALLKSSGIAGDSLVNMSENLSGLSGDFASFYNLPIEEAFEKIKSGISGETEPLKSLGINMSVANLQAYALSQGITKSYQSMNQAEQTQLRYNYLMSVSKDTQGDFNKTSDTFANQMRIAETNLSQMGASIATKVLPYLNKVLLVFNNGGLSQVGTILSSAFDAALNIMDSLKPNIEAVWDSLVKLTQVSGLDKIWDSLNPSNVVDTIQSTLKNVLDGFTGIVDFISNNFDTVKTVLEGVALGLTAYEIALTLVTAKQKAAMIIEALSKAWWVATGIIGAYREGMTLAAIAQDALNFAMEANPIGMITIGIMALIGLGIVLYENWSSISDFFVNLWAGVTETFSNFWNWITGFLSEWGTTILAVVAPFIGIPVLIFQHWDDIKGILGEVWNNVKNGASNAWEYIKTAISNAWTAIVNAIVNNPLFIVVSAIFKGILAIVIVVVYNLVSRVVTGWINIFTAVKGVLTNIWNFITSIWNRIYSTISDIVTRVWNVIVTVWNTIYSTVSGILTTVWNVIVTIWNNIYSSVSAVLSTIWNYITSVWNNVYNTVSSIVSSIWNTIVDGFTNAYNGIVSIFGDIKNTISSIFMDVWEVIKSVINSGIGMINGFIGGVNTVIETANKVPGVNIGTVSAIPQLANGGYIKHRPGGILANIGEGNEDEIVSPVSKLKNIINNSIPSQQQQSQAITYAPQIIIQGNASKDDIAQALTISKAQFKKLMDDYNSGKNRLSFGN
ncbi:DNA-binding protein [Clostridium sp.]|uniref:phage tail protein n=1 Tax=Clostridium sp. TaxID=1506 RepID=UPI00260AB015|nr:DNA-binding protein [Clostridium sp.]